MAFNISNLFNNKSNNTVLILVYITIFVFTILVSWYLLSGEEEEDGGNGKSEEDNTTPESESKKNITMPFIKTSDDAYVKTITPTNDAEALSSSTLISNNSYLGGAMSTYEIEKYEHENKDIEKILSKNVKISFKWKNKSGFTNVKKLTFKRYVFDETMNKTGPLSGGELTYDTSGTGYSIDTYVMTRPVSNSDANMKYFTNFGESDLVIEFDNDTNSEPGVLSTCTEYLNMQDGGLTECLKNNLYNVIGRNYITVKAQYVEDPAYPNDIAEKYLYKGGDGIPIQTEDLDMSLRIISPITETFSPETTMNPNEAPQYEQIKYTLRIGNVAIDNVQLENDPTSGSAYIYFKKDTNYFYIDDSNTLKMDGTSTNKQLFTLIQPNKDDTVNTTYRIIRVGDGSSGNEYRYLTKTSSTIVFKTQSEINTEPLWENMNVGFIKQTQNSSALSDAQVTCIDEGGVWMCTAGVGCNCVDT